MNFQARKITFAEEKMQILWKINQTQSLQLSILVFAKNQKGVFLLAFTSEDNNRNLLCAFPGNRQMLSLPLDQKWGIWAAC